MHHCLIFPFGGETKWIDLSLRDFPDLAWVVIVANNAYEGSPRQEERQFYQKAVDYANARRALEEDFPAPKQRQYKVLKVPEFPHFYEVFAYFRHLVIRLREQGFDQISVHLSSGLMAWRIALYQCAEEFRDVVMNPFLYNKDTGAIERVRIYRDLTEIERNVITLLKDVDQISLSDLTALYSKTYDSKTLSYILKVVTHLGDAGLVDAVKEGRVKTVSLSPMGRELYQPAMRDKYVDMIQRDLEI